jgi:polysaccharide export outer membrane protein
MVMGVLLSLGCVAQRPPLDGGEGQLKPLTIGSIDAAEGEQGIRITIQASRPFSYSVANHDKPPRVLVEIPEGHFVRRTSHILRTGQQVRLPVNKGVVRAIDLQERGGKAQVEVVLERLVNYDVQKEENHLVLHFQAPTAAGGPQEAREPSRPRVAALPPPPVAGPGATSRESAERFARLPKEPTLRPAGGEPSNPLEHVIGGMDVLDIVVYEEKDLSGLFRVSADGEISFPLVGNVRVAGLTPSQAQHQLEALLRAGYLKHPQVFVTVKEYRSKGVSILGAVKKPGAYQLWGGRMTLLEVLSMAEGVDLEKGGKSLILVRSDEKGEPRSITIDLDRLFKAGDMSLNMIVQPNDTIYVEKPDTIVIYGQVQKPGTYPFEGREMAVLEVLSKAGGLTQFAAPNRTRIVRVVDGKEKSIQVRVGDILKGEKTADVTLQPGDVIIVPESYF